MAEQETKHRNTWQVEPPCENCSHLRQQLLEARECSLQLSRALQECKRVLENLQPFCACQVCSPPAVPFPPVGPVPPSTLAQASSSEEELPGTEEASVLVRRAQGLLKIASSNLVPAVFDHCGFLNIQEELRKPTQDPSRWMVGREVDIPSTTCRHFCLVCCVWMPAVYQVCEHLGSFKHGQQVEKLQKHTSSLVLAWWQLQTFQRK